MDYKKLLQKKEKFQSTKLSPVTLESYDANFDLVYAHHSTAIEGNTLTLIETKVLLEDHISIGGKSLREIYEVVNHKKAFEYVKKCIAEKKPLDEHIVKDIHAMLMENIFTGGIYRNVPVLITGAKHKPPVPNEMYFQVKEFFRDLPQKEFETPIELAA